MAGIEEIIRIENDNAISFGNHVTDTKQKVNDFDFDGDIYKVKSYNEVTKLEKNSRLLYESVPGTTVHNFVLREEYLGFTVEGIEDAQITVELEPEQDYRLYIESVQVGKVKANLSGKISFSVDFANGSQKVEIKKV